MVWNWLRRHPNLVDVGLALMLGAAYIGHAARVHEWAGGVPLAVAQVVPLVVRRRYPRTVLAVVTGAWIVQAVFFSDVPPVPTAVAIYTVAANLDRSEALVPSAAATAVVTATAIGLADYDRALSYFLLSVAAWVVGDNLGTRRAYTRALEDRAERLEREREADATRARLEEQARIARELHDVIAHTVSVMVVQAAAANDVFDTRPERAREALHAIESSGRAALSELRRLLGAVRVGDADFTPQPGLERLDDLVAQVRSAGLTVAVSVEGAPRPLPAGVDLSAYRVVQEALTNALKHAGRATATVTLRYGAADVTIEVADNGAGLPKKGGGHGLIGMRERIGVFGGTFVAGPRDTGGFAVSARLPIGGGA
jgi:signal transduction histidine kinase